MSDDKRQQNTRRIYTVGDFLKENGMKPFLDGTETAAEAMEWERKVRERFPVQPLPYGD